MHLVLALDQGFEQLAAVALLSFLLHQRFESLVLVTPAGERMQMLEALAEVFQLPLRHQPIGARAALHQLDLALQPYFFCIEALQQELPGRYLYVDADTLCVNPLDALVDLPLGQQTPMAVCSHGRPMHDRSLVLGLESEYHYFNAGVMLFESDALSKVVSPAGVVNFYLNNRALCRFREQCALNALLKGRVQMLPGQYNLLSWMRARQAAGSWHDLAINPMAYCLPNVYEQMAIVHLSAGALPTRTPPERHERVDHYWLLLQQGLKDFNTVMKLPRYFERW